MTSAEPRVWTDLRTLTVLGTGVALPGAAVATPDLLRQVETRFEVGVMQRGQAFADKLGMGSRHLCRDFVARRERPRAGDSNPDLAARAVAAALAQAGLEVDDLAYLIGHTATPALPIPSNISLVADRLGFAGPHMELRQACTGFANALIVAMGLCSTPDAGPVAIVGSETGSVFLDPLAAAENVGQLVNLVQMGDGAGAIVVAPHRNGNGATISNIFLGQIGGGRAPGLSQLEGGSDRPWSDAHVLDFEHAFAHVRSTGPELFLRGARVAAELGLDVVSADYVLPHQASGRIGRQFEAEIGIPAAQVFVNAHKVGNTGSAAIWIALSQMRETLDDGASVAVLGAEATKHLFGGFAYHHG